MATERKLQQRAKAMRRNPTEPEKRLWRHLSNSQLQGLKFRRQTVIGERIVDFFCPALGLAIEVDGETHDPGRDLLRDARSPFPVLHFSNADVMSNMDGVLATILNYARGLPGRWPHPNPSPEGEGLERTDLSPSPSGEGLGVGEASQRPPP